MKGGGQIPGFAPLEPPSPSFVRFYSSRNNTNERGRGSSKASPRGSGGFPQERTLERRRRFQRSQPRGPGVCPKRRNNQAAKSYVRGGQLPEALDSFLSPHQNLGSHLISFRNINSPVNLPYFTLQFPKNQKTQKNQRVEIPI